MKARNFRKNIKHARLSAYTCTSIQQNKPYKMGPKHLEGGGYMPKFNWSVAQINHIWDFVLCFFQKIGQFLPKFSVFKGRGSDRFQ